MKSAHPHIGVVGAGAWGTALAVLANRAGTRTSLFARNEYVLETIKNTRINSAYLPDVFLDPAITVRSDIAELSTCDLLVIAIPAQSLRAAIISLSDLVSAQVPIVLATKGIERGSLLLMSEVVQSIMPANPQAVISGPNFASEAASGLPTAAVIASHYPAVAESLSYMLGGKFFRLYTNDDPIGTQLAGALKNVLAIACGIAMGRGLGENARAALLTRGMAEMARLIKAKGGKESTLMGLAGMGDAVLTCTSAKSRNYALGLEIGKHGGNHRAGGVTPSLQEGVATAESAHHLAQKLGVYMPVVACVNDILRSDMEVDAAMNRLLERDTAAE